VWHLSRVKGVYLDTTSNVAEEPEIGHSVECAMGFASAARILKE
jgi:hypothetical protein